jgi:hypothetical protein
VSELVIIVEGETEQTFVRDQLAAHLALRNTIAWPVLPGRHRNHGGVKKWEVARQDIIRTLKEGRYCSTMFDYYAMPTDWPGRADAVKKPWNERASTVEEKIHTDITVAMGGSFNPKLFVPYVQLHEFEALAFADVGVLASVLTPIGRYSSESLQQRFTGILNQAGHPEAINGGYETCPSRRIAGVVPAYKKRAQGPIVTSRIGIDILRIQCTHFGEWLSRLEQINGGGA